VSSRNTKVKKRAKHAPVKRTPRTLRVAEKDDQRLPPIIPESFNLKNFDIVGKIEDMRALTKELSIMARQLEQWVGVAYTISMAFKDNGVLKEVVKTLSSLGANQTSNHPNPPKQKSKESKNDFLLPPSPFSFFDDGEREEDGGESGEESNSTPEEKSKKEPNFNLFEIVNNPAFQEIVSKLFLQKK